MTTVFVAGTGTEVGKTWWAHATIEIMRERGGAVVARKPAQSYAPDELGGTDAEVLGRASDEAPEVVCPRHRWYEVPMAPPMAADALGRPAFTIGELVSELAPAPPGATTFVEGAGGPRSPLASDGDNLSLARAIAADVVVLVAPAGLGTINAVRTSADAMAIAGIDAPLVVALNRYDPDDDLHRRNHGWLATAGFHLTLDPAALADALARD